MLIYILKRVLVLIPTTVGVASCVFVLLHLTPGDPVEILLGEHALAADREALRAALGLNLPLWEQYLDFMRRIVTLDWGNSFIHHDKAVIDMLFSRLGATAQLAFGALLFALPVALVLGVLSAARAGKWQDKTAQVFTLAAFSFPSFWLGPMLIIVFSIGLGWLPVSGNDGGITSLILPSITLGTVMAAILTRFLRNSLLDNLHKDFIKTARAKGVNEHTVFMHHALKNALLPVITIVFLQAGSLLTGAILTEAVFSWPGVGSLVVEALYARDYPVVQGVVLFIAFTYMMMTLLSDILYAMVDPRVRYGGQH